MAVMLWVGNFYFASQAADVAARAALDTTIWPQPPSTFPADAATQRPAEGRLLPRDCLDQLRSQSYLQQLSISEQIKAEDIAHTLAPLEPPDGRRIAIVRSSDFARLYFLVLTPGSECKLDPVFAMGFPPGGKVEFDPDLRLIVINRQRLSKVRGYIGSTGFVSAENTTIKQRDAKT